MNPQIIIACGVDPNAFKTEKVLNPEQKLKIIGEERKDEIQITIL